MVTSSTPIVSRMECIEREGTPRSTVLIPTLAEMIGPMVDPQGQSFLTTNSCTGASARRESSRSRNPVSALVAYLDREILGEGEHFWSPLVAVCFDHSALVEERPVVLVMLLRVVRMDSMGHVSRHEERVPDRNLQHFV